MLRYGTFQKANKKGADQSARMRRLVCNSVVPKPPKDRFSCATAHTVVVLDLKQNLKSNTETGLSAHTGTYNCFTELRHLTNGNTCTWFWPAITHIPLKIYTLILPLFFLLWKCSVLSRLCFGAIWHIISKCPSLFGFSRILSEEICIYFFAFIT